MLQNAPLWFLFIIPIFPTFFFTYPLIIMVNSFKKIFSYSNIAISLGYIAGICTAIAFIPQVVKVHKTNDTLSLSFLTLALYFIGQILWASHGFMVKDWPVAIFAIITGILYVYLIYAKIYNVMHPKHPQKSGEKNENETLFSLTPNR